MGPRRRVRRAGPHLELAVLLGALGGFFLATWCRQSLIPCSFIAGGVGSLPGTGCCRIITSGSQFGEGRLASLYDDSVAVSDEQLIPADENSDADTDQEFIFVGVMTAGKYLPTRVVAAHATWASTIPGRVMFFSSEGSKLEEKPEIPVVGLPGVDDAYPPQKKSFLMLKYMHDNFIDKYEWFMRADDDVYIKGDKLVKFLHSINSSKPHFIGQAGLGSKQEFGLLSLDRNDNFCMGGPGMIFSRETLRRVVPHISYCLKNLYTTHEDVEIGRCVRKFAGVTCTWAFEMQHLFYHNHRESNGSFTHRLKIKEVNQAITLHPVKKHTYQYRLHNHVSQSAIVEKKHKILSLHREIGHLDVLLNENQSVQNRSQSFGVSPSLLKFRPSKKDEVLSWEYINNKALFSNHRESPKRGLSTAQKMALGDVMTQIMQKINQNARQRGRTIDFKDILYGYRRVNPLHGADYILDLLLVYRKHKGRKMTVPVRRHAYLQQAFTELEMAEDEYLFRRIPDLSATTQAPPTSRHIFDFFQQKWNSFYLRSNSEAEKHSDSEALLLQTHKPVIHFILPLAGRYDTFTLFMQNFEEVCLKGDTKVALAVMLFQSDLEDHSKDIIDLVHDLQSRYPQRDLRVVQMNGAFSRGLALAHGSGLFTNNSLLSFIDVDIHIHPAALDRIRLNTVCGRQVYYPIVFSQYDPSVACSGVHCTDGFDVFDFGGKVGFWRRFGFGIASMYKADLDYIGGFDTDIHGWGKEDVELFEKFVASDRVIFRTVDTGMVHIFHSIDCDPNLEASQYQMCLGTKAATYASTQHLAQIVYNNAQILTRNEHVNKQTNEVPPYL